MKLAINPKKLFRSKKPRSVSKSDQSSFSSGVSDQWATPTNFLPPANFDLEHAFKVIDRDGDGVITRDELEALFSKVSGAEPPSQEELTVMVSELDRDGDGCISLDEFSAIVSAFGPPACHDEMRETFEFFDTDHDGRITAEELLRVFTVIGDGRCTLEDCKHMISEVDKNGYGFVCFEDFRLMMEQQR